jgi:hypothetical protein
MLYFLSTALYVLTINLAVCHNFASRPLIVTHKIPIQRINRPFDDNECMLVYSFRVKSFSQCLGRPQELSLILWLT